LPENVSKKRQALKNRKKIVFFRYKFFKAAFFGQKDPKYMQKKNKLWSAKVKKWNLWNPQNGHFIGVKPN
jgi:hypothetical protein